MKLYSYWRSTAAYRARIALNLKEVDHEILNVDLLQQSDSSTALEYREVNPQGLVPSLTIGDQVLTQSTAIVEYLEERFPEPPLLPSDLEGRAVVRGMCQLVACDIHPLNNLRVLNYLRGTLEQDDMSVAQWYKHWVGEGFAALAQLHTEHGGQFLFGDKITMADIYLVPQMYNARRFDCAVEEHPKLVELDKRLLSIPAFFDASPERQMGS